jgi:hypothetical protein
MPERAFIAEADAITFTTHLVARGSAALRTRDQRRSSTSAPTSSAPTSNAGSSGLQEARGSPAAASPAPGQRLQCAHRAAAVPDVASHQTPTGNNGCVGVGRAGRASSPGTLAHTFVEPLGYECFDEPPTPPASAGAPAACWRSSLATPHMTGPNLTDQVRKAYRPPVRFRWTQVLRGVPAEGPASATHSRLSTPNGSSRFCAAVRAAQGVGLLETRAVRPLGAMPIFTRDRWVSSPHGAVGHRLSASSSVMDPPQRIPHALAGTGAVRWPPVVSVGRSLAVSRSGIESAFG